MNDEIGKNKLKLQDIMIEIDNLKKYASDLANNSQGEKLENYIDKLEKDIEKAQDKLEIIYTNNK